ncbi:MAG TPA: hypothetical protein EYH50_01845 [Pyrodictium delaneyi]|uniref:Archaeal coiled-coil protein n=1 Tax=Pyrodictium delaneyi TaxID=1273541 RepID=A0A833A1B7_9CREN|nr:hypothetical protein [Pyrodictium delaneyi]
MQPGIIEASEKEILDKITALREEIKQLKEKRYSMIEEVRGLRQERRQLIERAKQLREQIRQLREKRRQLVEEVRSLRQKRREVLEKLRAAVNELEQQKRIAAELRPLARRSINAIRRRIEELEWRQQTQILTPQQEKEIIDEITRLEALLQKTMEARQLLQELAEKRAELMGLRLQLRSYGEEIRARSERISRIDERINTLRQELESLSSKIDELTKTIEEKSHEIDELREKINSKVQELRQLSQQLKSIYTGREREKILQIYSEKKRQVEEKLKRGEPLTLEELKLLYATQLDELEEEGNEVPEESTSAGS